MESHLPYLLPQFEDLVREGAIFVHQVSCPQKCQYVTCVENSNSQASGQEACGAQAWLLRIL